MTHSIKILTLEKKKFIILKFGKTYQMKFDVLIYAVPHVFYEKKPFKSFIKKLKLNGLFFDLRGKISEKIVKKHNRQYITL